MYAPGQEISDDDARRAGLMPGTPTPEEKPRGLVVHGSPKKVEDAGEGQKPKPLERMKLDELKAVAAAEQVDAEGLNTRAEYIEAIEQERAAREFETGPDDED
jgi:hypothetical protein